MDKISELKQQRAALVAEMRSILDAADAEKRSALTAEEQQNYDRLETEVDSFGARITTEEGLRSREIELAKREDQIDPRSAQGDAAVEPTDDGEYRKVFVDYIRHGMGELDKEQRSILRRGFVETRDQVKGTTSAGGFLVPTGFVNKLYEHLIQAGAVRQTRVQVIETTSGESIQLPKTSSHGAATLLAEGSSASSSDEVFAQLTLDSYTYARLIKASLQLIEDEVVDVEAYLAKEIGRSIGALQNAHFVTGTGTAQPQGITVAASVGKTGLTGQTTTIIYDDVVDLVHSVGVPYRRQGEFLAADGLIKALRKLKDADGLPIWQASLTAGEPDTLLGHPVHNDPDMPAPAASAKSLAYGDFNGYVIRDVKGVSVRRLDERFADSLQVGFLGWLRSDGDLLDSGALKTYAHSAT